jgi:hypothetical protein
MDVTFAGRFVIGVKIRPDFASEMVGRSMFRRVAPFLALALAGGVHGCGGKGGSGVKPDAGDALLTGSVKVTWSIVSPRGDAVSCSDLGIVKASAQVGGTPIFVDCGQEQVARFDQLMPDNYPVIVQLFKIEDTYFTEMLGNVRVNAGEEATASFTFTIDPQMGMTGGLTIRWRINDEPAATGCAHVNGATVRVQALPGSKGDFESSGPCTDGKISVDGLQAGDYGVLLALADAQGTVIANSQIPRVTVASAMTAMPNEVAFVTRMLEQAKIHALWTVNGMSAATSSVCMQAGTGVVVKAFPLDNTGVVTYTASTACTNGQVQSDRVPPGTKPHRVVFELYQDLFSTPPIPILLTSTEAKPFFFIRGMTTTVSVDLKTMSGM